MAIVVETGAGVAGANSYVDLADARALLATRGMSLDAVDATAEIQLIQAAFYLESYDDRILGTRADRLQLMLWPRADAEEGVFLLDGDTTPDALILSQCLAAVAIATSELIPSTVDTSRGKVVTRTKVGPLEKQFTVTGEEQSSVTPAKVGTVDLAMRPILKTTSGLVLRNCHV